MIEFKNKKRKKKRQHRHILKVVQTSAPGLWPHFYKINIYIYLCNTPLPDQKHSEE